MRGSGPVAVSPRLEATASQDFLRNSTMSRTVYDTKGHVTIEMRNGPFPPAACACNLAATMPPCLLSIKSNRCFARSSWSQDNVGTEWGGHRSRVPAWSFFRATDKDPMPRGCHAPLSPPRFCERVTDQCLGLQDRTPMLQGKNSKSRSGEPQDHALFHAQASRNLKLPVRSSATQFIHIH